MPEVTPPPIVFPSIRVRVGYPWTKDADLGVVAAKSDPRWQRIRKCVISAGDTVRRSLARRKPASSAFQLDVGRLRGTHGQLLLHALQERIAAADILLFDIGSHEGVDLNPNVLIETGMALALASTAPKHIFILKPSGTKLPSDLQGFLVTDYDWGAPQRQWRLKDPIGFHAALRSVILRVAERRGMAGPARKPTVRDEDDE